MATELLWLSAAFDVPGRMHMALCGWLLKHAIMRFTTSIHVNNSGNVATQGSRSSVWWSI